jgi:hypothetical protein
MSFDALWLLAMNNSNRRTIPSERVKPGLKTQSGVTPNDALFVRQKSSATIM